MSVKMCEIHNREIIDQCVQCGKALCSLCPQDQIYSVSNECGLVYCKECYNRTSGRTSFYRNG